VAGVAADALRDVNAVIEINEIGKLIDAGPLEGLAGTIAGADWFEQLGVGPDLRVAVHASAGWRNAGETGSFHRRMTIAAVDAEPGDVMLMAERNGLRLAHARISDIGRALDFVRDPAQSSYDEDCAKYRGARQCIRAAMKDLRHALKKSIALGD